jgi:hypothetical protein
MQTAFYLAAFGTFLFSILFAWASLSEQRLWFRRLLISVAVYCAALALFNWIYITQHREMRLEATGYEAI